MSVSKVPKVYIDPGHGGRDPGAVANGLREKDIVLNIARRVEADLRRHGVDVRMSRTGDDYRTLQERTNDANRWGADALVSIHINASPSASANGFEVWHSYLPESPGRRLASCIAGKMDQLVPLENRGTKFRRNEAGRDFYHMIRESRMPAVIVEAGFITNPDDARYLREWNNQATIAEAITRGVLQYLGLSYKQPPVKNTKTNTTGKHYRLKTGTFHSAEDLAAAKKLIRKHFPWVLYEWAEGEVRAGGIWSPVYRLLTGTFDSLEAARDAADRLKKVSGWVVYVIDA